MNNKKILIVEDDKTLLEMYKKKLEVDGNEVRTATDGNECFEVLPDFQPDVILLDLLMPNVDGFETLEKIRTTENLKETPVIIITNMDDDRSKQRALVLGANEYLIKSDLTPAQIIDKASDILSQES